MHDMDEPRPTADLAEIPMTISSLLVKDADGVTHSIGIGQVHDENDAEHRRRMAASVDREEKP